MASVPGTAKRGIGAGGVLVVLLAIALALGAGHHHLAVSSSGGGGGHVIPHLLGTPADPCQNKPDDHEVLRVHAPGRSRHGSVLLDCAQWRQIVNQMLRGTGGRGTIRQLLACIQATVHRGDWARNADSYAWRWGKGPDDIAVVIANAAGRIGFVTAGPGKTAWKNCARAAS